MSDNYTEFSFSIPLATPAECEWVETLFADPPKALRPDWCGPDDLELEFEWTIEVEEGKHVLVIFSVLSCGNPDKVEEFFKLFLAGAPTKLRKLGAEFAHRCEEPDVDTFGGSAVCVEVANDGSISSTWISTASWLKKELEPNG